MSIFVTTAPKNKPLTLAECKQHLRVTDADDDSDILALIDAATDHVESYTKRALMNQSVEMRTHRGFPCESFHEFNGGFEIPRPPLVTIHSIKYIDTAGVLQTLATSVYTVDINSEPGRVVLAYGQSWPSTRDEINNVRIAYTAGYGEEPNDVPQAIKQAMLLLIDHWFEHRSEVTELRLEETPMSAKHLLWPYRVDVV